jgi:hypothetical protein
MIALDSIQSIVYHLSGAMSGIFFLYIVYILKIDSKQKMKSMIFLRYQRFRMAFYILAIGATVWLIGNILGGYDNEQYETLEILVETVYNICIFIFSAMLLTIFRPASKET